MGCPEYLFLMDRADHQSASAAEAVGHLAPEWLPELFSCSVFSVAVLFILSLRIYESDCIWETFDLY